jgi:hypothetical protein
MRVHATNKIFFHPSSLHEKKYWNPFIIHPCGGLPSVWKLLSQFLLLDDIRKRRFLCKFDDVLVRSFVKKKEREVNLTHSRWQFSGIFSSTANISINKFYANCDLKKIYIRARVRLQFQSRRTSWSAFDDCKVNFECAKWWFKKNMINGRKIFPLREPICVCHKLTL